ncbi:23S rRNA (guanosine(2251)-2'-O)-methyltransferase RlmB [Bacteroidia bacterium]|nr:23S rRNA (guanosine(2251)-2'-O)-methyltransferase RlmB [Bacteroidia bacterium]
MENSSYTQRQAPPQNLLFGIRPLMETLKAGKEVDKVLLKNGLDRELAQEIEGLLRAQNILFQYVPIEKLNRLTRKNHQGVVAFASLVAYADLQEILISVVEAGKTPLILLLDEVTDVRNFGAIARSAECAGVHAIVVPTKGAAPINGDAMKTSAGALNLVPVCRVDNLRSAISLLHNNGVQVVAASEKGATMIYDTDLTLPTAIVMGAEESGVSPAVLKVTDALVKIPLQGSIASLNVSAAASVVLFEAIRQRLSNEE